MMQPSSDSNASPVPHHNASLQAALDLIDQGFSLMDRQLRVVAWNCAFLRVLDLPPGLVCPGVSLEALIRFNAERGDYGPGDADAQVVERMALARRFVGHEFERRRPNGQVIRIRGVPVPGLGFVTIYTDVTAQRRAEAQIREHAAELERRVAERTGELRRSEAQMRLITDSIPALIAYFDDRKAYRYINKRYQEWFGVDPARVETASAREMLGEATYAKVRPHVARALAGEATSCEYETHCIDGRVRRVRTTLIPERAADGRVIGCFELTFDITEASRAQELLSHAQKMEALGQLTGGLAHDFNNMLAVIVGNLSTLHERRSADAEVGELVDPALAAAQRGIELIRSLLGFARRQPLEEQPVEVRTLLALVVKLLQRSLAPQTLLRFDDSGSPSWVWVDPSRLQDALVNVILNARDADAKLIVIRTSQETLDEARAGELQLKPDRYVRIDVTDDGHGMDAATRSRVFEPFFTTKRSAGTGLGMSMVYGFVRQSEGAIDIASAPGCGTTVSLWLPVAEAAEGAPAVRHDAQTAAAAKHALALLVEDDPDVRKVVRRSLVDLGFAVIEAENGAEAVQILDCTPKIELMLADVVMPGDIDGREVARHAIARRVPRVALMSGYVPGGQPLSDGVPLLPKPFTKHQLADFLQQQVSG
jgi:PAS domain S-box-containing protein